MKQVVITINLPEGLSSKEELTAARRFVRELLAPWGGNLANVVGPYARNEMQIEAHDDVPGGHLRIIGG